MFIPRRVIEEKLRQILAEDVGQGDITTSAVIPGDLTTEAKIVAKEYGVIAGIEEITIFTESLGLQAKTEVFDGKEIHPGETIMAISGNAQTIFSAERSMLNLLGRMSGIATRTREITEKIRKVNPDVKIAATRKTAPGLLYFDKKAVLIGGGDTHRMHLDDMILIKDNHIAIVGSIERAVQKARENSSFSKKIEVEVPDTRSAIEAGKAGADIIMLDNFSPTLIRDTMRELKKIGIFGKVVVEVSGNITSENIMDYASNQVNIISLGELTDSAKALDISLEITKVC